MRKTILSFILFFLSAGGLAQTAHDRNAQGNDDYQRSLEQLRRNRETRDAKLQYEKQLRNEDYWGAFSYLARGNWTFFVAVNEETESSAKQKAQSVCQKKSGRNDCEVIVIFKNTCAAIAVDNDNYFSGTGRTKKSAERSALEACKRSGSSCEIAAEAYCSDYYSAYNKSRPWF